MSGPQWTPGPWQWVGYDEIEQVEHPFTSVADLVRIYGDNEHTQRNANARLIAAAPELYEALARLLTAVETTQGLPGPLGQEIKAAAHGALTKVRGETL